MARLTDKEMEALNKEREQWHRDTVRRNTSPTPSAGRRSIAASVPVPTPIRGRR